MGCHAFPEARRRRTMHGIDFTNAGNQFTISDSRKEPLLLNVNEGVGTVN
jgi:hypothetical protein